MIPQPNKLYSNDSKIKWGARGCRGYRGGPLRITTAAGCQSPLDGSTSFVLESFTAATLPPPVAALRDHDRPPRFSRTRHPTRPEPSSVARAILGVYYYKAKAHRSARSSIVFAARPDSWHDVHGFSQPPTTIYERDIRRTHRRQSKTSTAARRRSVHRRTTTPPPPSFA